MKRLLLSLLFLISITGLFAAEIDSVTIYQDRAMVTRVSEFSAKAGSENKIVFSAIPFTADLNSLRSQGLATKGGGLKILDLKVINNYTEPVSDAALSSLKEKIKAIELKIEKIDNEKNRLKDQKKLLDIFAATVKDSQGANLKEGDFSLEQWMAALQYYEKETARIDGEIVSLRLDREKLAEELSLLRGKYNEMSSKDSEYTQDVEVYYTVSKDCEVALSLQYIVGGVYWYPLYDARLAMKDTSLSLEYFAKIYQETGEDWDNVNITLSTARPDLSGSVPEIYPWILSYYEPYTSTRSNKKYKSDSGGAMYDAAEEYDMDFYAETEKSYDEGIVDYEAEVSSQGLAVAYNIGKKTSVVSGEEETKVIISTGISLQPELKWAMVPRYNTTSFLTGKITNSSEFVLLPGEMSVFVDSNFIGKSAVDMVNPKEEFDLSFGRDPRITAEFVLADTEKGSRLKKKFEERTYEIKITNNATEKVSLNVKDVIPKSENEKIISIKIIELSPEPNEIEYDSVCSWDLTLNPSETKTITVIWEVEYSSDYEISNL